MVDTALVFVVCHPALVVMFAGELKSVLIELWLIIYILQSDFTPSAMRYGGGESGGFHEGVN